MGPTLRIQGPRVRTLLAGRSVLLPVCVDRKENSTSITDLPQETSFQTGLKLKWIYFEEK